LQAFQDDRYVYVAITYAGPPRRYLELKLDLDGDQSFDYCVNSSKWRNDPVKATISRISDGFAPVGIVDILLRGRNLELRIDKICMDGANVAGILANQIVGSSTYQVMDSFDYLPLILEATLPNSVEPEIGEDAKVQESEAVSALSPQKLGSMPQAIEIVDDIGYVLDWNTGTLQSVTLGAEEVTILAEGFPSVSDIASVDGDLLIVNESGEAWIVDPETGDRTDYSLGIQFSGEVLGIEHSDDTLYSLVYQASGPKVIAIQDGQSTSTPIQIGEAGELISLQLWKGKLLTLDYQAGIVFELVPGSSSYSLAEYIVLSDLVPIEEQADAGIRGMFLTDDAYYFTSVSFEGGQGKLHVVDVSE
ncbi:hypothetical protein IH601_05160, partial [Candidatus Bipolaricaulota bacterium]|nr:hypothetical protein [Candidatus Bipolaricaulota bacterium]